MVETTQSWLGRPPALSQGLALCQRVPGLPGVRLSNGAKQCACQCLITVASSAPRGVNGAILPLRKQGLQGLADGVPKLVPGLSIFPGISPRQPSCALVDRQPCHLAKTSTEATVTCRLTARPYTSGMTGSTSTMTCAPQVRILSHKLPGHCPKS